MRNNVKRPRINWKKEIRKARNATLREAIESMKLGIREVPEQWRRGYYSAITQLEVMEDEN